MLAAAVEKLGQAKDTAEPLENVLPILIEMAFPVEQACKTQGTIHHFNCPQCEYNIDLGTSKVDKLPPCPYCLVELVQDASSMEEGTEDVKAMINAFQLASSVLTKHEMAILLQPELAESWLEAQSHLTTMGVPLVLQRTCEHAVKTHLGK